MLRIFICSLNVLFFIFLIIVDTGSGLGFDFRIIFRVWLGLQSDGIAKAINSELPVACTLVLWIRMSDETFEFGLSFWQGYNGVRLTPRHT